MPSALPEGEAVPRDGSLPASALTGLGSRPFGVYLHVPFCATRCGYCDFNTYTAVELGGGASQASYASTAVAEVRLARQVLGTADVPAATVFLGGGTPTLLPPRDLATMLAAVRDELGIQPGAEVTTEANPDSVDERSLADLRAAGFTRVSFGMQSAVPHVLATLDRTHDPDRVPQVVAWARAAGFEGVSLDLIYGTPGESQDDWRTSLAAALDAGPDHVSAYALVVEEGTRLAGQVRRGEIPAPDDDDLADRYLLADEVLAAAGFEWYEVSNWPAAPASGPGTTRATGAATTGGASDREPTATWAAPAGGTCATPRRTPVGWPRGPARRTPARCSPTTSAGSSSCCWASGCVRGIRWPGWRRPGGLPPVGPSTTGCSTRSRTRTAAQR
jgi:oxygen-independent coproporphyrinogen-3 oxidase